MADNETQQVANPSSAQGTGITNVAQSLFGYLFQRKDPIPEPISFAPREVDDGAVIVAPGGSFGTYIDLDGTIKSEAELVTRYREMMITPETDMAVEEICDEVVPNEEDQGVKIVLDDVKQSEEVKKAIELAFADVMDLLDYRHTAYQTFRRWYIDGRLYFHVIIDEANTKNGIQELRYIDPRKIRKVREVIKRQVRGAQVSSGEAVVTQTKNEYFLFSDKGFNVGNKWTGPSTSGVKIAKDAIVHATSGLTDALGSVVLGYLHKAIKPLNQLRVLEDSSIIYRLTRAPERRVWYIDIGNLPKMKAEQYVRDIMVKHKNRVNYDPSSGEILDNRRFITMLEDFWLPRRSDGQGTKVETLPPGTSFNQIDDILYFQKKLYQSLGVPVNRLNPDDQYNDAVATGITRDEIRFGKLVARLRKKYSSELFTKLLEKQLVLKQVMSIEDFQKVKSYIAYQFSKDNEFKEMKEMQVWTARITLGALAAPFVGRWFSDEWIRKNFFNMDDIEIEEIDEQIANEALDPQFQGTPGAPPEEEQSDGQDQEEEDGAPGVMVDPGAVAGEPNKKDMQPQPPDPNKAKGAKKPSAGKKKKKAGFKSVADFLAKGS